MRRIEPELIVFGLLSGRRAEKRGAELARSIPPSLPDYKPNGLARRHFPQIVGLLETLCWSGYTFKMLSGEEDRCGSRCLVQDRETGRDAGFILLMRTSVT